MAKSFYLCLLLSLPGAGAMACDGCSIQQPRFLRNITHGPGPETQWDYWIVAFVGVLVILTLFYSLKWLIRPGEKSTEHIKNLILTTV